MEGNTEDKQIIGEMGKPAANILDPKVYYYDTLYPGSSQEKEPTNPHIPHFKQVLKHYGNKAQNLRNHKAAIVKLMEERKGKS